MVRVKARGYMDGSQVCLLPLTQSFKLSHNPRLILNPPSLFHVIMYLSRTLGWNGHWSPTSAQLWFKRTESQGRPRGSPRKEVYLARHLRGFRWF